MGEAEIRARLDAFAADTGDGGNLAAEALAQDGWDRGIAELLAHAPEDLAALLAEVDRLRAPIPMVLHCPACGEQHVDAPREGWDNPPHRSHLCHRCDHIWRPADVATTGVRTIETRGAADSPRVPPSAVAELERVRDLVWAMANEVEDTRTVACRELADRLRALTQPLGVSP